MDIYFDNSATTRVAPMAARAALQAMEEDYGNPSSLHGKGAAAARLISQARESISPFLLGGEGALYFTSGGSESNNAALWGLAEAYGRKRKRILISAVEHPSVKEPALALEKRGFAVEMIPVDSQGRVDLAAFEALLREDLLCISVQQVNHETGAIQPLEALGRLLRIKAPQAFFHVDGVQGFCKLRAELALWGADLYSGSGHKLHAPKGCGFLWVKKGLRLPALIHGGGQEQNFRSGTENVPGIAGLGAAAAYYGPRLEEHAAHMDGLRRSLWQELQILPHCHCNSSWEAGAPHILNLSFPGVKSEALLHHLEEKGLYVSAGSACTSRKRGGGSPVLQAMDLPKEWIEGAIRFSFCPHNTREEVGRAALLVKEGVEYLRGLSLS